MPPVFVFAVSLVLLSLLLSNVLFDVENVRDLAADLNDVLLFSEYVTSFVKVLEPC